MDREDDEDDQTDPEDHRHGWLVRDAVPGQRDAVAEVGRKPPGTRLERSGDVTGGSRCRVQGDQS
jgi:hypothetical protein